MYRVSSRAVCIIASRLKRLGIAEHPGLFFKPSQEGYRNYIFGARSGPSVQTSSLFHELAHAAELGPEEFEPRTAEKSVNFSFSIPEVFVFDRFCYEPKTIQAIERELRTFAYQFHLMHQADYRLNIPSYAHEQAQLMRFMADWWLVPGNGEEARVTYCSLRIKEHIEALQGKEAFQRLIGWLDCTRNKLTSLKLSGRSRVSVTSNLPDKICYRGTGEQYSLQ